ncbi:MAG: UDP-N-acetylenolpyruvoylglucosamine reductase [Chitinophagaceae bacterium]|nr:UDP-N-acetylenolpyruvoylglucosamine reductase [Chitinophagaceae bacterium]
MKILENISLKPYNTFGIDAKAKRFASFSNIDELAELLADTQAGKKSDHFVLGGGSNILFTKDFDGTVLKNELKGIELVHEDEHYLFVKAAAGETWHQFVLHCIEHNYAGLENLSLIPGNVGASPMQNIGAYGVEIKDVFHSLEAYHIKDKKIIQFTHNDCEFGYRESVFKRKYKNQFVILDVTFRLSKHPVFHTSYGAIQQEIDAMGVKELSIKAISDAVIRIRQSKLPDPAEIGNAGSFFKNPQISKSKFNSLKEKFPGIVGFELPGGDVKLAAAWLIEQCGWKGFRDGDAGVHTKQALVLVNYKNASGNEIFHISEKVIASVKEKFDIDLEREVNII